MSIKKKTNVIDQLFIDPNITIQKPKEKLKKSKEINDTVNPKIDSIFLKYNEKDNNTKIVKIKEIKSILKTKPHINTNNQPKNFNKKKNVIISETDENEIDENEIDDIESNNNTNSEVSDDISDTNSDISDIVNEETNDEIITNKLLYNTHEQILENEIEPMIKRKIYFEVHGCQMNTNDTEVALAILNKTGLYEKINNEKEADIVLISIYLCLVKFKFGF